MVLIAKPLGKPLTKPTKTYIKTKSYFGKNRIEAVKTKSLKKWSFSKNVKIGKNGACGHGRLDYNINPHTSVGVYGDGCIGNPFSHNPIPTTIDGGGVVLDIHF